jgi:xanthine/uracil permease
VSVAELQLNKTITNFVVIGALKMLMLILGMVCGCSASWGGSKWDAHTMPSAAWAKGIVDTPISASFSLYVHLNVEYWS